MKTDTRYRLTWGSRLRLGLRLVGLTGLLAAGVGAVVLAAHDVEFETHPLLDAAAGGSGSAPQTGALLLALGLGFALIALVVELAAGMNGGASGRSLARGNAWLQTLLAIGIAVALNVYSFQHYARYDLTRDGQFTLPPAVADELKKLSGETTIVVLEQHNTFGRFSGKPDNYDSAAEKKVVEKVADLVELFREFGPQFRVATLDVQADDFARKLDALDAKNPGLKAAVSAAPENSIFFAAAGRVQRLSFNEFDLLDKSTSKELRNLVMLPQGAEALARPVLAIQEKKPRVGLLVVHEVLTSTTSPDAPTPTRTTACGSRSKRMASKSWT